MCKRERSACLSVCLSVCRSVGGGGGGCALNLCRLVLSVRVFEPATSVSVKIPGPDPLRHSNPRDFVVDVHSATQQLSPKETVPVEGLINFQVIKLVSAALFNN